MKHLFIINPAAGKTNQSVAFTKAIAAYCKPRGLDYETTISACRGDCTALARRAAQTGEEYRIYACGGDGTLNEVVCGVVGFDNVAITHFPGGSGNDFIRMFSNNQAFRDLSRLMDGPESEIDVISVNHGQTYALNICSMGIDARIGADVSLYKRLPGLSGSGAYNLSTAVNVIKGVHRPCQVEIAGETIFAEHSLICVCNGQYYGGGFHPIPQAAPDDGMLDVLLVRAVSRLTVAKVVGVYKRGGYAELPEYITPYRVEELTIRCPKETVFNVDGEIIREKEVTFTVAPEKIRFFHPEECTYKAKTEDLTREIEKTEEIPV